MSRVNYGFTISLCHATVGDTQKEFQAAVWQNRGNTCGATRKVKHEDQ